MAAAIVATSAAIVSAVQGAGVYALIVGVVAGSGVKTSLFTVHGLARWRPRPVFDGREIGGHVRFGAFHLGQRVVNFATGNADQFLIGAYLGATPLGYYSLAMNLAILLTSRLNAVVGRVFFPLLSRLQHDVGEVRRIYFRVQELTTAVSFPIQLGLTVTAPVFVPLFFGADWTPSAVILQILALGCLARAASGTVGPLLLALGRTELGFRWSLLVVGPQVLSVWLAVRTGRLEAVAITYAGLMLLFAALNYVVLIRSLLGSCLGGYLRTMAAALGFSVIMAAAVWGVAYLVAGVPAAARLVIEVGTGVIVYGGLVGMLRRVWIQDFRRLLRGTHE